MTATSDTQNIQFIRVGDHALPVPNRSTTGSVGYDLRSRVEGVIEPGGWALFDTGFRIKMPHGVEAQVRSRSGLALKHGVCVLNSPGTIDSDYEQSIGVILINHGKKPFPVLPGDRIAQLVFNSVIVYDEVEGQREGGFGSTGVA